MKNTDQMTKAELIEKLTAKGQTAHPLVKRVFLRGLQHRTKAHLMKMLKNTTVTRDGDIHFSRPI
jgi:hypothetical protein